MVYFDASKLPEPKDAYVAWVDVMGVRAYMSRSLPTTANFVFKLHAAVLDTQSESVILYPVMDGAYAVAASQVELCRFLERVFVELANEFIKQPNPLYRFLVKGSVAYGRVFHGADVPAAASQTIYESGRYKAAILLGMPMVQAFQSERQAPPFGVFIHESARAFSPTGSPSFSYFWWAWHRHHAQLAERLRDALEEYFEWCLRRSHAIDYDAERIVAHREQARQFFVDL
jgi:hypothetical protein